MTKKALGIDLGTTNSAMAIVKNGKAEIIPIGANDEVVLRSAVYFSNIGGKNRAFLGKDAINRGTETGKIEYFKQDFKRDIARDIESEAPNHTRVNSVILSALLLNSFKKKADIVARETGSSEIRDAVITVPAYFTSEQRAATKNAGRLAGLNVLRIINEPTAAAIAYAHEKGISGNVLVYDLGGGTFDVTVMRVANHRYDILATNGNHRLGGLDFDKRLVNLIKEKLEEQGLNMTGLSPKEEMQLRYQAEKIKIALSINELAFYEIFTENGDFGVEITRTDFQNAVQDLVKDTQFKVEGTLRESSLTWADVDHILLVGGSTRMPIIRQMIEKISGKKPHYEINPDTIVAAGASIIADLIVNNKVTFSEKRDGEETDIHNVVIRDVTSQGLGMLFRKNPQKEYGFVGDYFNSVVVPRNTQIPVTITKDLYAFADNQPNFQLRLTEGNYPNPMNVQQIVKVVEYLDTPRRKGEKLASVELSFDEEQIVHISIIDALTNRLLDQFDISTHVRRETEVIEDDLSELQEIFNQFVS